MQKRIRKFEVPDTLVIILSIVLLAWVATFFIQPGSFSTETVSYQIGDRQVERQVLTSGSFQYADSQALGSSIFDPKDDQSLLSFAFLGLTSGSKYGAAIGVIAFLLIIGGAFGILLSTGAIDLALKKILVVLGSKEFLLVPILCFTFSLGGAVFGMGEEAIAFAMILTPVFARLGYNPMIAIMCTYVATQIGFATSWMNPFNVAVAQGLSGVPIYSGAGLRIVMYIVFTIALIGFTSYQAKKSKQAFLSDKNSHQPSTHTQDLAADVTMTLGHYLIIATLGITILWIIWGVIVHEYYIPEIATQFFTMGLVAGIIACVFGIGNFTLNKMAKSFREGAEQMLAPALVVGMAQGILIVLGGTNPEDVSVLNTILHNISGLFSDVSSSVAAVFMLCFQSALNFFVTSGSGQAALTIPLMAPIADLVGVTRQTAILAFQLGDGLTNIIVPTSASLMGTLGVAKVDWAKWAKFISSFLFLNFLMAFVFVVVAVFINY
ncbi:MAG: putative basic amino acid antiporter YfcC [Pseudobacteriovorax sp.]|nr:putative basic amino acid antiporter YfcC [Pseudobacteriovorax sp.]